jgi:hypothetical protein
MVCKFRRCQATSVSSCYKATWDSLWRCDSRQIYGGSHVAESLSCLTVDRPVLLHLLCFFITDFLVECAHGGHP